MTTTPSPTPPVGWMYENLLAIDPEYRMKARELVKSRLPSYTEEHCEKLLGGSPYEYLSRCVLNEDRQLIGVMAFAVGQLGTVEIVAFVSSQDGKGIGRCLMEHFVAEMKGKQKSSILTYIEPSAFEFFSRFGFSKHIPARSLYEKITSKYVRSIFMYKELLEPQDPPSIRPAVGDRILVMVDGTLTPRQAVVKDIRMETGEIFVHYFFWNTRYDEWIFSHSPRVRYDLPLPPEPPKTASENMPTTNQVKKVLEVELKKEKKFELVHNSGSWPKGIKKGAPVQVSIEGNWIKANVIEKTDQFLYCEFEYNGTTWMQDFPRDMVKLPDGQGTLLDELLARKTIEKKRKKKEENQQDQLPKKKNKPKPEKIQIELSPEYKNSDRKRRRIEQQPIEDLEDLECSVCRETENRVLVCGRCKLTTHPSCNMGDLVVSSPWICDLCTQCLVDRPVSPPCAFCGEKGESIMKSTSDFKWVHTRCAIMAGLSYHSKSKQFSAIKPLSPSKGPSQCELCDSIGGNAVSCDECKATGHVACIQKAGWKVILVPHRRIICPNKHA